MNSCHFISSEVCVPVTRAELKAYLQEQGDLLWCQHPNISSEAGKEDHYEQYDQILACNDAQEYLLNAMGFEDHSGSQG